MRVLIGTVTAGGGHLAAAAALEEAWRRLRPNDLVERLDLLDFFAPLARKVYSEGYLQVAQRAPEVWGMVFRSTDTPAAAARLTQLRRLIPSRSRGRFLKHLRDAKPDAVLCTHYLPLEALGLSKQESSLSGGQPEAPRPVIASIVTDFEAHALWMDPCVSFYCVAAEHTRARLVARGARPEDVVVTGIPISERFAQPVDGAAVRRNLGLRDDLPVLLVLSGGFGMGPVAEIVGELDKAATECQMVIVTGRNEELRRDLAAKDRRHPTRVLGFVSNMDELMSIASLIISKPGGLTSSEALALGKPMLILNPIPGQEAANSDLLLEMSAAAKVNRVEDLPYRIEQILAPSSPRLREMSAAARALGRPRSAEAVCRETVSRVEARFARGGT